MTMQIANNPLFIEDLSPEANQIARGSTAKRHIIVKNLGDKKADIDIWIAATDEKSEALLRWCTFSEQNPLKLAPKENSEVILSFEIPPQATPDLYNYEILIEAPVQYPNKLFRRPQQLRVLRSNRDTELGNEPVFTLQPLTNSANPYLLQSGEKLAVKVIVENRSRRVDRFYLNCPELANDWFTINYPESRIETSGLVKETDGLELNPGNTGEITLILHPPQYTLAGYYFPTVRLISSNKEELEMLDVVYLEILPDETLNVELQPLLLKIPTQEGKFEVLLINQGNITREIAISARDREELFTYTPEITPELIPPGYTSNVPLRVKPRKWWRRPIWRKALEFNFDIELENNPQLFLSETTKPLALPKQLTQGTLVWEPRPWWQVWLPLLLLLLLAFALISVAAFLYWQKTFIQPKINQVEPIQKVYQEIEGKPVSLNFSIINWRSWEFKNWRFQNTRKLSSVKIIPQSREGLSKIISYDSNQLLTNCQIQNDHLNCTNISTETKKAGEYTFKIEVYSQGKTKASDFKETDSITIEPIDTPKIIELLPSQSIYREAFKQQIRLNWKISNPSQIQYLSLTQQESNASPIKKTFIQCTPQEKIKELVPGSKTGKIEKINNQEFLVCQGIATNVTKAGNYNFKLEVFSKQNPNQPSDSKQTDTITIQPVPIPQVIDQILSNKLTYEYQEPIFLNWRLSHPSQIKELRIIQQSSDGSITKNTLPLSQCKTQSIPQFRPNNSVRTELGNQLNILRCENIRVTPTKAGSYTYKIEVVSQQNPNQPSNSKETDTITVKPLPVPEIAQVSSTKPFYEETKNEEIFLNWEISNAKQVKELRLIGLAGDGSVSSELKRYFIVNNILPPQLRRFCQLTANLICQAVPTGAKKAGDYTFKLTVVPKQGATKPEITKNTATVKIKPVPPKPPTPVNIVYFKVNGQDVSEKQKYVYEINKTRKPVDIVLSWKVEDGEDIKVELLPFGDVQKPQGSKIYTLSKPPSSVTLTLKVRNKAGEEKTQSVTIDTIESTLPSQLQTPTPGETAPETASPLPAIPDRLSPIELPPKPD